MQFDYPSLSMILKNQPKLYDLHTHLLGMGNAGFWVDTILMDKKIMPRNSDFKHFKYGETVRKKLCPLIWDKDSHIGFVDGVHATDFLNYLVENNILPAEENNIIPRGKNDSVLPRKDFSSVLEDLEQKGYSAVVRKLINKKLNGELLHRGLNFKEDFSYDVVLSLSDLAKGLGVKQMDSIEFEQLAVTEKLVGYSSPGKVKFRDWIVFNARKQEIEIVYGIQVEELRELITVDPNKPNEARKLARAHIINAFSMCNAQGTPARLVDLHSFHGSFTPEFYPRRFALKDSIYSQRPDVLAALIGHIIERYRTSLPPVEYCEFSVGVGDLSSPWMFDVLRSVRVYDPAEIKENEIDAEKKTYKASDNLSSFSQIVLNNSFPHLENAFKGPKLNESEEVGHRKSYVTYKFLAGFGRQNVESPLSQNQNEALRLLYDSPQQAILLMIEEIIKSKNDTNGIIDENPQGPFAHFLKQLKNLKEKSETMPSFYDWVVGLDLFGDELGYPYCPFVARPFIEYIKDRRTGKDGKNKNKRFGLRIHCGENVIYADDDSPAYRLFIAHMYIAFRCLQFLQRELKHSIRIGHGIAFDRILGKTMSISRHRKSSVLLADMREHANYLFKTIAFEVNITSNEYLLGQTLRQADFGQILRLNALFKLKANIILATDDDGIWPIDQCKFVHPGHHSLSAEYCRAISSSLFSLDDEHEGDEMNAANRLQKILTDTPNFCFWEENDTEREQLAEDLLPSDDDLISNIVVHPNIIRLILEKYKTRSSPNPAFDNYKIYYGANDTSENNIKWENDYGPMRVAFMCIRANDGTEDDTTKETIRTEYCDLFKNEEDKLENLEKEFNFIYQNWRNIRSEFIFPKETLETVHHVKLIPLNESPPKQVIYSEPLKDSLEKSLRDSLHKSLQDSLHGPLQDSLLKPLQDLVEIIEKEEVHPPLQDMLKELLLGGLKKPLQESLQKFLEDILKKPLQDSLQQLLQSKFMDFLRKFHSEKVTIYAFAQHMDVEKTVEAINKQLDVDMNAYKDMALFIFMNKNKYKYTHSKIDNRFKLQVNPNPSKRDYNKQNFTYALCQHASAATAALHLISEQFNKTAVHSSTRSSDSCDTNQVFLSESNLTTDDNPLPISTEVDSIPKSSEKKTKF